MKNISTLAGIFCVLLASSCTSSNSNKTFATIDPSSTEYKKELIKEFLDKGTKNLTFNFNGLKTVNGRDYMEVLISGKGLQAQSLVLINNWKKLEGIKQTKGLGYRGAELAALQLDIVNTNGAPTFVYRDLAKIID